MGRRKKDIDEEQVAQLALDGASNREIAAILGCDDKTVANRFSAFLQKKRAERRVGLRKAQTAAALAGDKTMLVWLGKQELGQRDKFQVEARAEGGPRMTIPENDGRDREREQRDREQQQDRSGSTDPGGCPAPEGDRVRDAS